MQLTVKTKRTHKILSTEITGSSYNSERKAINLSRFHPHYALEFTNNAEIDDLIKQLEVLKTR